MSNSAQVHWAALYPELTKDYPGVLGVVTARSEAHTQRLALTYAQLDMAERIEIKHLEAAVAFTRYAFDSARYLFSGEELNPSAQRIVDSLKGGPKTQTEINIFDGRLPKEEPATILTDLQELGRITQTVTQTPGRPRTTWSLSKE